MKIDSTINLIILIIYYKYYFFYIKLVKVIISQKVKTKII
jgi:hypothetical protein